MTWSGSLDTIRLQRRLSSGWLGTMADPDSSLAVANSNRSRRNSAWRPAASWPWQRKQAAERIGRMSRLKDTFSSGTEFGGDGSSLAPACPSPAEPSPTSVSRTSPSPTDLRTRKKEVVADLAEFKGQ